MSLSAGHPPVHSDGKFGRPWRWKEIDSTTGGKPEKHASFQSLFTEVAKGENEKTPCLYEIFIKKQIKTVSNGLFECISSAGKQPMISGNCITTLCLLIFFSPYLIIICSSICLFKYMWENRKGYRGQSKNCILLPGFPELIVQLFVFDEITMKIELFKANGVQISFSQNSLPHSCMAAPSHHWRVSRAPQRLPMEQRIEGKTPSLRPPRPLRPTKFLCYWNGANFWIPGSYIQSAKQALLPTLHILPVLTLPS